MSTEDYRWPCTKRRAHGAHGLAQDSDGYTCPGVLAHPDTMAGRGTLPLVKVEDGKPVAPGWECFLVWGEGDPGERLWFPNLTRLREWLADNKPSLLADDTWKSLTGKGYKQWGEGYHYLTAWWVE